MLSGVLSAFSGGFVARFRRTFMRGLLRLFGVGVLALGLVACSATVDPPPGDSIEASVLRCAPQGRGLFAEVSITNLDPDRTIELVEVVVRFADDEGKQIGETATAFGAGLLPGSKIAALASPNNDEPISADLLAQCDIADLMVIWER